MRFVYLIFILISFLGNSCSHPSDEELQRKFLVNKEVFIELKDMLIEDKNIVRMDSEDIFYIDYSKDKITESRFNKYKKLFETINLTQGIHRDNESTIRFIVSTNGFPLSASEKSILYTTNPLLSVHSADGAKVKEEKKPYGIYQKIDKDWYLFYENW